MARTTARSPRQPRQGTGSRERRLQRRRETRIAFEAIAIEGALLQPELIARIAQEPDTPQRAAEYGLDPGEKLREVVQSKFALAQSLQARFLASDRGPKPLARFLSGLFAPARGGAAVPVRGRQEPHGHRAGQGGAVDRDRGARQAAVVP